MVCFLEAAKKYGIAAAAAEAAEGGRKQQLLQLLRQQKQPQKQPQICKSPLVFIFGSVVCYGCPYFQIEIWKREAPRRIATQGHEIEQEHRNRFERPPK